MKELEELKNKIDEFDKKNSSNLKSYSKKINTIVDTAKKLQESWSGSWLGYHASLYFDDFQKPPPESKFDVEWGGAGYDGIPAGWAEKTYEDVKSKIRNIYDLEDLEDLCGKVDETVESAKDLRDEVVNTLSFIKDSEDYSTQQAELKKIEDLELHHQTRDLIRYQQPSNAASRDSRAILEGMKVPPHIQFHSELLSFTILADNVLDLIRLSRNVLKQIDLKEKYFKQGPIRRSEIKDVIDLCNGFHRFARKIKDRYDNRETVQVEDEYDVQDLLNALLYIKFEDIRKEEWNPSYAGSSSRSDFLIKEIETVIEVKKTRKGLEDREIGEQIIIDIAKYSKHPDCKNLICFIYDPEGRIGNPVGLENDLNEMGTDDLNIITIVNPK